MPYVLAPCCGVDVALEFSFGLDDDGVVHQPDDGGVDLCRTYLRHEVREA
jgi:hypothetical protein